METCLNQSAESLRVLPEHLPATIDRFFNEWKEFKKDNERLKEELAHLRVSRMADNSSIIGGMRVVAEQVPNADADELVKIAGELAGNKDLVVILASDCGGVKIVAAAGEDALKAGADAGKIVTQMSAVVGGGGGGRPNMARGGGTDPLKISDSLKTGMDLLKQQLKVN
jgi:alanyl-tRNA synthetase